MKRIAIGVLLLIPAIAGCHHEAYFYNPDKTLDQAKLDCETCHEDLLRATVGGTTTPFNSDYFETLNVAGDRCMEQKGYSLVPKDQLPPGIATMWIHRNLLDHGMAGK